MKKLILQMQTSADMFVADTYGGLSWMQWSFGSPWTWSDDLRRYHIDTIASADTVLLSDKMAQEGFIDHWSDIAGQKNNPQATFAKHITDAHKIVFSQGESRYTNVQRPHTEVYTGDFVSKIQMLKQQPGKNIIVFGGIRFAAALIVAGLVDEFHFVVNPVILGSGLSIFSTIDKPLQLQLASTQRYKNGMMVVRYSH